MLFRSIAGASAYALKIDWARFAKVAKDIGALFLVDMAHYSGLIAGGVYPNPVPHADVVTSTTHKSLRGPRGGIILMNDEEIAKKINSAIFPGLQGGPLMHIIAAKAAAFGEALKPEFKKYQQRILDNAKALAESLIAKGLHLVSGGTDNHLMLVDLRTKFPELTAKKAQETLDLAHITCNKNTVPFETRSPFQASGIRLGTPAVTTRGFVESDMTEIAEIGRAHV